MIEGPDQGLAPPPPPPPDGGGNPWERRDALGYGAALLESVKLFVTSPAAGYEATLKKGDFLSPLLFAVIVGWFGAIIGQIWQYLFQGTMLQMMPPEVRDQLGMYMGTRPVAFLVGVVLTPVFMTIGLFIWSLVHHVSLLLVGALDKSDSGFEGTFRVNGYAYVSQLAAIIPVIGWVISIIWYVALLAVGAVRIHGTTGGRSLLGALLPLLVCCACVGLVTFMVMALFAGAMR